MIVYDDLEADHDASWQWLIHSPEKITPDTARNTFLCSTVSASSETHFFASGHVHWSLADTFAIPAKNWSGKTDEEGNPVHYADNQYHLSATSAVKSGKIRFLAVILVSTDGHPLSPDVNTEHGMTELTFGDWTVSAQMDTSRQARLEAFRKDGSAGFTSSGATLTCGGETFTGRDAESAKLVEKKAGKLVLTEAGEHVPRVVAEIPPEGGIHK